MGRIRTSWIVIGTIIVLGVAVSFGARVWLLSHDRFNWRDNWRDVIHPHPPSS